ncbi:MAG: hypothetical protein ACE5GZ_08270 [Gammaproteobacteria bacterium]
MATEIDHEKRSQQVADSTRRYLIGVNTGGIGVTVLLAANLVESGTGPQWIVGPVSAFTLGLVFVGVSLFLAKHRSVKRSTAKEGEYDFSKYKKWYWRSFTWDIASGITFILAVWCGLMNVAGMS